MSLETEGIVGFLFRVQTEKSQVHFMAVDDMTWIRFKCTLLYCVFSCPVYLCCLITYKLQFDLLGSFIHPDHCQLF